MSSSLTLFCRACNRIESVGDPSAGSSTCPSCGGPLTAVRPGDAAETRSLVPAETADLPQPQAAAPGPGRVLPERIGRFLIRRIVGEGAFGVVYEAYDPQLRRVVALKVGKSLDTPERVERFLREARSAANLRHPNVVAVFDSGTDAGRHYIASAFIPGGTLEQEVAEGRTDFGRPVEVVRKLAEALAYAHSRGVVHRDIKPANVLIDEHGEPLLADFGLAAREADEERLTREAGRGPGTPAYMAPEQAAGRAEAASDQYSLGCMLYELLTGRTPFDGPPELQVYLHQSEPPPSPRRVNRRVPRDLETVCLKCLEKEPDRRYEHCQELADDLRRWAGGEPVTARRVGLGERLVRWAKREPYVAGLLAAVVLVTVFGVAGIAWAYNQTLRALGRAEKGEGDARTELSRARVNLCTGQLLRVAASYQRTPTRALELLHDYDVVPIDLRDCAWGFYERACSRWHINTFEGHGGTVHSVAFSPDGRALASGSGDRTVKVCDVDTGRERACLRGHTGTVFCVAFSLDGKTLASGSDDGMVKLWDLASSQEFASLTSTGFALAFSPDGKTLASAGREVKLWDLATRQERASLKVASGPVAYSPDGKTLATGSTGHAVQLWDVATGRERAALKGHTGTINGVAFNPDGKTLASGSEDRTVKLWDAESGRELLTLKGYSSSVSSVVFSPDGNTLASGGTGWDSQKGGHFAGEVKLWDVVSGQELVSLTGHTNVVSSVAISPDGRTLASGSWDRTVRLWEVATFEERATLKGHAGPARSASFSPDGRTLASGGGDSGRPGEVKLWDVATGEELATLKGHKGAIHSVAFSPDGKTLASGGYYQEGGSFDREVKLWDLSTRQVRFTNGAASGPVAFTPDGKTVAVVGWGGQDKMVKLLKVETGQELASLKGRTDPVHSLSFSPDGKTLAFGSADGTVREWNLATRQERTPFTQLGSVGTVAYSPDGKTLATGSTGHAVQLWDVATGRERAALKGHTGTVSSVAFSPDGGTLASGSEDKTVRLWDAASGQERAALKGHKGAINSIAFSPGGETLASAGGEVGRPGEVKLWDVARGSEYAHFKGDFRLSTSIAFSPDSTKLISKDPDKTPLVWDLSTGQRLPETAHPAQTTPGLVSPDGRWEVKIEESVIRILDRRWKGAILPPRPRPSIPNPNWHQNQAEQTAQDKQWFATGFHLHKLANQWPWDGDLRMREATAWAESKQHDRSALAFVRALLLDPKARFASAPQ